MSDRNKNRKTQLGDFLRYRSDEMTGKEKNSFEKELQKDPFADEAAEGFSLLSPEELSKDMTRLQKGISKRTLHRSRFIGYRIAASVAVLMMISSVFIIVEKNKSKKPLSNIAVNTEVVRNTETKPVTVPLKDNASEIISEFKNEPKAEQGINERSKAVDRAEKMERSGVKTNDVIPGDKKIVEKEFDVDEQESKPLAALADKGIAGINNNSTKKAKVLKAEDKMNAYKAVSSMQVSSKEVVSGLSRNLSDSFPDSVNQMVATEYFSLKSEKSMEKTDSLLNEKTNPADISSSEIVVAGYGEAKSDLKDGATGSGYQPPQPLNGKSAFDKYIQENLRRPDSATAGQRVVVIVSFLVRLNGFPDSINIIKSPGKEFSDEAIRVIKSGPLWKPAVKSGNLIEDKVNIRIIFY
jgi:hypothetical protein